MSEKSIIASYYKVTLGSKRDVSDKVSLKHSKCKEKRLNKSEREDHL